MRRQWLFARPSTGDAKTGQEPLAYQLLLETHGVVARIADRMA
jgi:hypothetical protein